MNHPSISRFALCPPSNYHAVRSAFFLRHSPVVDTERRVPELIPVLGSPTQLAGAVSHKTGGRLPLLTTRPAVTLATLKRAATSFAA